MRCHWETERKRNRNEEMKRFNRRNNRTGQTNKRVVELIKKRLERRNYLPIIYPLHKKGKMEGVPNYWTTASLNCVYKIYTEY